MKKAMNVGIVGLGDISGIYLQNIVERYHQLKVVAVCDILYERALAVKKSTASRRPIRMWKIW